MEGFFSKRSSNLALEGWLNHSSFVFLPQPQAGSWPTNVSAQRRCFLCQLPCTTLTLSSLSSKAGLFQPQPLLVSLRSLGPSLAPEQGLACCPTRVLTLLVSCSDLCFCLSSRVQPYFTSVLGDKCFGSSANGRTMMDPKLGASRKDSVDPETQTAAPLLCFLKRKAR